jgi:tetratricopeptide (TPR) repeat protein
MANIAASGIANPEEIRSIKQLIDNDELQQAIALLHDIIRDDDENFVAHYFLGVAYAKRGLSDEALTEFRRTIELGGWEDTAYYNIGIIYESMGFYDQAYAAYEAAHRANPDDRTYLRARDKASYVIEADLGFDTQYQLRFNDAAAALVQVPADLEFAANAFEYLVVKFPHKVEARHMLGVVRSKQGKLAEAEEIFRKVIEMEPGFGLSYYNLGILYQTRGRWAEARDVFMKCLNLTPDEKNRDIITTHIRQVEERIAAVN